MKNPINLTEEVAKKTWLAGLGLLHLTNSKTKNTLNEKEKMLADCFESLVQEGEKIEQDMKQKIETKEQDIKNKVEKNISILKNKLGLSEPEKDKQLEELTNKVEALTKQLEKLTQKEPTKD